MTSWKMWVPVGIIVIAGVAYFAMQNSQVPTLTNEPATNQQNTQPAPAATLPNGASASADIDAAVNAVIGGGAADQTATKDEEANASTAADSSAMSDVGTAFTDNDY